MQNDKKSGNGAGFLQMTSVFPVHSYPTDRFIFIIYHPGLVQ
jgi:hypothetical protein